MNFPYTSANTAFVPLHQAMKKRNSSAFMPRFSNPHTGRSQLKGNQWQIKQASGCHRDRMRSDWCLYQEREEAGWLETGQWAEQRLLFFFFFIKPPQLPLIPLNEITSFSEEHGSFQTFHVLRQQKGKNRHSGFSHHPRSGFVNSSCSASETWGLKIQPHFPGWQLLNPISDIL